VSTGKKQHGLLVRSSASREIEKSEMIVFVARCFKGQRDDSSARSLTYRKVCSCIFERNIRTKPIEGDAARR
jgi:hypothetical protein